MISRDSLRKIWDMTIEKLDIPEWQDFVYVRSLTGEERDSFENSMFERRGDDIKQNLNNLRARLVVLTACDDKGERIFSDADISWLGTRNARALERIFIKAQELSGLRKKDIEDMVKNSGKTQDASSISE